MTRKQETEETTETATEAAPTPNKDDGPTVTAVVDAPHVPAGTPVIADGGRVGKVLSHDRITGQVQIAFDRGGRGWYRPSTISTVSDTRGGRDG